ncbi:hypothetical protein L0P88_04085 [Muricauda sp. SCSIO 64092]|uniref:hypothetical protein n=1 Tax=Allomuricauda sp. SCSIO 64092 TaxID=2908842 RepID=UPI001FF5B5E6|nr:hypothetical protein [Muricauda sp. SCSIO 64092]UOY07734.1 hypothetical protein L0P88_04085 [Muricauda sp. SCSIO 64092]
MSELTLFYIIAVLLTLINLAIALWAYRKVIKTAMQLPDPKKHFFPERGQHFLPEKYKEGFTIRDDEGRALIRTAKPMLES